MSNHINLVVKLMPQVAESWTENEVLERWAHLFTGPLAVQQWRANHIIFGSDQDNSLISLINHPKNACYLALNRWF
jgi:hypothetical protein